MPLLWKTCLIFIESGRFRMKILSKKKCEEILKRITANEIIQVEYGLHDIEAETKATENRAEKAFIVGGVNGMNKVQNTLRKRYNNINHEEKD